MQGYYWKASIVIRWSKGSAISIQFFEVNTSSGWRRILAFSSKREDQQALGHHEGEGKNREIIEWKDRKDEIEIEQIAQ